MKAWSRRRKLAVAAMAVVIVAAGVFGALALQHRAGDLGTQTGSPPNLRLDENPSTTGVWAGDAGVTASAPLGSSAFYVRTAAVTTAFAHRAWEVAPGSSTTVYFERAAVSGATPPGGPSGSETNDLCRIRTYFDDTSNVHATLRNTGGCPALGTSFTVWCTSDGTSTGTPIAGVLRIRLEINDENTPSGGGVYVYRVDSDSATGGISGGSNPGKGAIRCGMDVTAASVNSYPAGSTFAYTVAGETMTCTFTHTRAEANQVRTAVIKTLDGSAATIESNSLTIGSSATSTSSSFTLTDTYPAASTTGGCQLDGFGNSVLTGVHWTHINSATSPLTAPDSFSARRAAFYNFDSRITATHHLQVNAATLATPPVSIGSTRTLPDVGYIATRFTNARGEGLSGSTFAFTRTLQDHAHVLAADTLTCSSSCISTQGGQAGWGPVGIWNAGGPTGTWDKAVDVTGPSTIDSDAHLVTGTQSLTLNLPASTTQAGDPIRVEPVPPIAEPGDVIRFSISATNLDGTGRTGATITVNIWNEANTQVVTSAAATEVGVGLYRYDYTVTTTGHFLVRAQDNAGTPVAGSSGFYVRSTAFATAPAVATLQTTANTIDANTDQVEGYTDTVEGSLATAATAHTAAATAHSTLLSDDTTLLADHDAQDAVLATAASAHTAAATAHGNLQADTDDIQSRLTTLQSDMTTVKTNVATLVSKWGSTDAATLLAGVQDLQAKLGTPADTSSASTVFGKIALAHAHSDANDATTQAAIAAAEATADSTYTLLADVHTELGAHGKTRTAFRLLEDIEDGQLALDAQADTYHNNETEFIAETHEDVHEVLDALAELGFNITDLHELDNATLQGLRVLLLYDIHIDNATAENVTEARTHNPLDPASMDNFNDLGFDGFLFVLLFITCMLVGAWRMSRAGPRWGLFFFFSLVGFLVTLADLTDWITWSLAGMGLGVLWIVMMNRFGAERPKPASSS